MFLLSWITILRLTFTANSRLKTVLLRDTIMYFGGALAVILTNFVIWKAARVSSKIYSVHLHFVTVASTAAFVTPSISCVSIFVLTVHLIG